jgi:hypothetical protein
MAITTSRKIIETRFLASGIWRRVVPQFVTNVSEQRAASVFRVGNDLKLYQIAWRRISGDSFCQASNKMEKLIYSRNSWYNSTQNTIIITLLIRTLTIKIHRTIVCFVWL